ncbi:MAG: sigma-70 family RNA polymerase sigma factor [Planctomycetes bacterium]|nr:sigma-70 family RNA polymerase sigma factor [Planctomycetota bacterium]
MATVTPEQLPETAELDLAALYDLYGARLYAYARLLTHSPQGAEDAVHDAFVRLARRGDAEGIEDLRSYLFRTVRNEALRQRSRWARWRRRDELVGEFRLSESASAEGDAQRKERAAEIERAMAALPGPQREVVFLKVWHELTFEAIGEVLEISPNTAASRYRYGAAKLREALGHDA